MNTRLDTVEEKMSELEDTSVEMIQHDPWKGTDKPGPAQSISEWGWGGSPPRGSRIHIIGVSKGAEVEKGWGRQKNEKNNVHHFSTFEENYPSTVGEVQ